MEENFEFGRIVPKVSLSSVPAFTDRVNDAPRLFGDKNYSDFIFEALNGLHIFKLKGLKSFL